MRNEIFLPALAVGAGAVGAGLRRWALSAAFEADTGLPLLSHPAMLLLIAFTAAVAAALALLCRACPAALAKADYRAAFYAPEGFHPALGQAAGILLGLSAVLTLMEVYPAYLARLARLALTDPRGGSHVLQSLLYIAPELVQGLLGLLAAACLFLMARELTRAQGKLHFAQTVLLPAFYTCFWLISFYRAQATDPVVPAYAWHLFAIIAVVLAMYHAAGFSFGDARPRLTLYFSLLGLFFCLTTLPDAHSLGELLTLCAFLLWLTSASVALLHNLLGLPHAAAPSPAGPTPPPEEDDDVDIVL